MVNVTGNVAYMDAMPDLMSETISMGTLGKQAEYDRRRRRKYVDVVMAALCNRAGHYIFALWFVSSCSIFLA